MTDLRPMQLGEIVDRSAAFWRAHWKRLYGLFITFSLVQYVLLKGGQALLSRWSPSSTDLVTMLRLAAEHPDQVQSQAPAAVIGLSSMMAILIFATLVMTTAASHWVLPTFLGEPSRVLDGVKHAARRLGTLAGLFLLAMLWAVLVLVLFLLPGVLLAITAGMLGSMGLLFAAMALMTLGCVGWALWFFLRFALWGPVVALENVGVLAAFRRCDALTSGRIGRGLMGLVKMRLMVLITVVALLLMLISLISGAPIFVLRGIYGNLLDPAAGDVPAYLLVPAELLNLAVGAVMYPLYVAFQTLFYADMRMRREGLDLELKLKGLPA